MFPILCKTVLEEAKRREFAVLTTTRLDGVSIALTKWGFPEAKEAATKYDGFEGVYRVFLADYGKGEVERVLQAVTKKVESLREKNIFVTWERESRT